eukprot:TRINITY_DN1190_c0_g3_i1.p1 TRINITY_DN1190_c0_g3~~TRINITY_DN1190_c0_g3_i1.p1  ORF type:complete len:300 (+),score=44.04 TRINITY_DN1190_c0_g3_i1:41-940(+)
MMRSEFLMNQYHMHDCPPTTETSENYNEPLFFSLYQEQQNNLPTLQPLSSLTRESNERPNYYSNNSHHWFVPTEPREPPRTLSLQTFTIPDPCTLKTPTTTTSTPTTTTTLPTTTTQNYPKDVTETEETNVEESNEEEDVDVEDLTHKFFAENAPSLESDPDMIEKKISRKEFRETIGKEFLEDLRAGTLSYDELIEKYKTRYPQYAHKFTKNFCSKVRCGRVFSDTPPPKGTRTKRVSKVSNRKTWKKLDKILFLEIYEWDRKNGNTFKQNVVESLFSVNRTTYYRWKRKYERDGIVN